MHLPRSRVRRTEFFASVSKLSRKRIELQHSIQRRIVNATYIKHRANIRNLSICPLPTRLRSFPRDNHHIIPLNSIRDQMRIHPDTSDFLLRQIFSISFPKHPFDAILRHLLVERQTVPCIAPTDPSLQIVTSVQDFENNLDRQKDLLLPCIVNNPLTVTFNLIYRTEFAFRKNKHICIQQENHLNKIKESSLRLPQAFYQLRSILRQAISLHQYNAVHPIRCRA